MDWNRLAAEVERTKRKASWKIVFGEAYSAFADCLLNTGDHVSFTWCDSCKCSHQVLPASEGEGFVAVCRCADRRCADIRLSADEAAAWEFSAMKLGQKLGAALGLGEGADVQDEGFGLVDLGVCPRHPERLHVWLVACPVVVWPDRFLERLRCAGGGCLLMPGTDAGIESVAHAAGLTVMTLGECFEVGPDGIKGVCGERCRLRDSRRHEDEPLEANSDRRKDRILIVDDSSLMVRTLSLLISAEPSLEIVGDASNGLDALGKVEELKPDLVIMDFRMPVMDGVEATRRIKAEFPGTIVIGLTSDISDGVREMMLNAGATEFLDKIDAVDHLVPTILSAIASRNAKRSGDKVDTHKPHTTKVHGTQPTE